MTMFEVKETSPASNLCHGHVVVGPTPVPLTALDFKLCRGILLRAPGAGDLVPNTDIIYIGRACVTADSNPGTGGMPLLPGAVLELPLEDPSQLYAVSLSAAQDLAWMGM
jgi:hypothetical protein